MRRQKKLYILFNSKNPALFKTWSTLSSEISTYLLDRALKEASKLFVRGDYTEYSTETSASAFEVLQPSHRFVYH